jgi:ubiquinone biosynthesis protein COQ9
MTKSNINDTIKQEKSLILIEFLKNTPFEGWSERNLANACATNGFDPNYAKLLFPSGLKDLNSYFNDSLNDQMTEIFLKEKLELKISEKIAHLLEIRFSLYQPIKESIRCLFQYNLMPQHFLEAQNSVWKTCDQIWYLAGDKSTDFNYYSKRALLETVYSSSLLYYLSDESENFIDTKAFIRRRIQSVLKIGKWKAIGKNFFNNLFK